MHTSETTAGREPAADVLALTAELVRASASWGPSLTPDGSRVAFVSDRRGIPELWVRDVLELDHPPTVLPVSADPVVAVRWSPDGQWLACSVATGGGVRTQVWVVRPDGSGGRQVAGGPAEHVTLGPWMRRGHRLVIGIAPTEPGQRSRCDLVDPATGDREVLASGALIDVLDSSPDERFVLIRDGRRGAQFCVLVDREADTDRPLLPYPHTGSTEVGIFRPAPGGVKQPMMAYLATDAGLPRRQLVVVPVGGDGRRAEAGTLAGRDDGELEFLDADQSGRRLVLVWNVAGRSEIELLDPVTMGRRSVPGLPGSVVSSCVMSRDGRRVVLCVEGPGTPRSLWVLDPATMAFSPLGEPDVTWSRSLVGPSLEHFVAHDGLPLTGWLYRPPHVTGPGPVLLSFHGGPEAQERPTFNPQHQAVVAAGISVFAPNVRGSSGFGRAFVHADDRYGRIDGIADVESCARFLIDAGVADPARIAVSGRSYGGYLTLAALVRFPELFAAGIDICGMSDLLSFFRDTETWIAEAATTKYGDPLLDRQLLHDLSPLNRVEALIAPLLVVHGVLDTNVPLGEAVQLVNALVRLRRPVEFLRLEGEGHEYRLAASKLTLIRTVLGFLARELRP